jgi:hypothetical protein
MSSLSSSSRSIVLSGLVSRHHMILVIHATDLGLLMDRRRHLLAGNMNRDPDKRREKSPGLCDAESPTLARHSVLSDRDDGTNT